MKECVYVCIMKNTWKVCVCVDVCVGSHLIVISTYTHTHTLTHRYSAEGPIRGRVVTFLNQSERKIHLKIIE